MKKILLFTALLLSVTSTSSLSFQESINYEFESIHKITDVKQKKFAFFSYFKNSILNENKKIMKEKIYLLKCKKECQKNSEKYKSLKLKYRENNYFELIKKVDIIPAELALNQAANESGWGGSRFSLKANNLFGMWCFTKNCGIVPLHRPKGKIYEVKKYDSVYDSISHYMLTINRNEAYSQLREIRYKMRKSEKEIDPIKLARGLTRYSERGNEYVDEIQSMIKTNRKIISELITEESIIAKSN